LVQTVDLGELKRDIPTLLADVAEFMQLQPGDVLMVGSDCLPDGSRPRARAGDRVDIVANGMSAVRTQVRSAA
jgi:5-oxopent-3-ene-1,2,5-tricarboxylate decarboxylase/2-hydroxyhepta-2,4-diene-1,7-dioate isomerase